MLHHFFTEDVCPDNRSIVDLQRRAVWIALALILQALNEIDHDWYIPYLMPFGSLIPFVLLLGSFFAMWMAFRPTTLRQKADYLPKHPRRWQRVVLAITFLLAAVGGIMLSGGLVMCFLSPQFFNDGTSLDTNAAIVLLEGHNPYTDSSVLNVARRFSIQPDWTTPLRRGQFAGHLNYPTKSELQKVLNSDLKTGLAPEFESNVSYPALSFLTLVPFALFKDYNVLPFYLLSYLVLVAIAWKVARPELRPWVLLLSLANISMWSSTISGNLDIFVTLLIVVAWLTQQRRWLSAILLGLALATKQSSWFLLPFYLVMIGRHYGWKETLQRLTIAGCVSLACNLPFILWNPHAWLTGVLTPVADPMFPMGVGLINLSITHLLPFFPNWIYGALEGAMIVIALAWYWRLCRNHPAAAMLLAVLPLFFAWRSLPSYFYCSAYPLFILLAAKALPEAQTAKIPAHIKDTLSNNGEQSIPNLPLSVGLTGQAAI